MAVSIILYVGMGFEAMTRDQDREMQGCSNGIEACGGVCASLCGLSGYMSRRGAVVWGLLHAALVGAFAAAFFLLDHLDNNYMDDSLPETGNTSAPQYINCKDRLSGIYPAVGAFAYRHAATEPPCCLIQSMAGKHSVCGPGSSATTVRLSINPDAPQLYFHRLF